MYSSYVEIFYLECKTYNKNYLITSCLLNPNHVMINYYII